MQLIHILVYVTKEFFVTDDGCHHTIRTKWKEFKKKT